MTGRGAARASLAAVAVAGLGACGGGGPSRSEEAVCASVEAVVRRLAADDGRGALQATARMAGLVRAADNTVLAEEGRRFFTAIGERRDVSTYTVEEIRDLGERVLESGASSLGRIVTECERVGAPVDGLDAVPQRLPDPRAASRPPAEPGAP